MARNMLKNKFLVAAILLVLCTVFSTPAFAWQGRARNYREASRHNEAQRGFARHGDDNRAELHGDGWFWGGIALSALAVGAIIASLPRQHETVYVDSTPAVAEPVMIAQAPSTVVVQPQWSSAEAVVINVPNVQGGYTPVVLTRRGNGYVGPQGEYYSGNPTVEQLKTLYGQ